MNTYSQINKNLNTKKNLAYIELGGVGSLGSINYERLMMSDSKQKLLFRVGMMYMPLYIKEITFEGTPIIPIGLYYLYGSKHNIEFGANSAIGYTFDKSGIDKGFRYVTTTSLGYRFYDNSKNGLSAGLAYLLGLSYYKENEDYFHAYDSRIQHWFKLSIGYVF
ncbi:hypothetical protein ACFLRI_00505 [Bacteroidota bacterium]